MAMRCSGTYHAEERSKLWGEFGIHSGFSLRIAIDQYGRILVLLEEVVWTKLNVGGEHR